MVKQRDLHDTATVLHSAALRLLRRARTADSGMDLDGPRASLLSVLVFGGPTTVGRLAEFERVTPPAITKLVTALERDGLVSRVRSTVDRRVVEVAATEAGRQLLYRGRDARVRVIEDLFRDAPADDLRTLQAAADLILSRL